MATASLKHLKFNSYLALLLCTLVIVSLDYLLWLQSEVEHPLLPADTSRYPWTIVSGTDSREGGLSVIEVEEQTYSLEYAFKLDGTHSYPFAHLGIWFTRGDSIDDLMDWNVYSQIRLTVRCEPRNVLTLILHSFDAQVTDLNDFDSFRPSNALFNCDRDWQTVDIDLHQLNTPEWWLKRVNLDISNKTYDLGRIKSISLGNTSQSPVDLTDKVKFAEFTLTGRDWSLFISGSALLVFAWLSLVYWTLRQRTQRLLAMEQEKAKQASLTKTYQPLPTDSKKEKGKRAAMQLMATEFTNPELDLDTALSRLGTNRTKLNAILKEETGMTFSVCLNHLRLTEAARLLTETDLSVAEIAFKVGYNNASYFNRVFRKQFLCTPGEYKQKQQKPHPLPESSNNKH